MSFTSDQALVCSHELNIHYQLGCMRYTGLHLLTHLPLKRIKFLGSKTTPWQSQSTVQQDAWKRHFQDFGPAVLVQMVIPMWTNAQWQRKKMHSNFFCPRKLVRTNCYFSPDYPPTLVIKLKDAATALPSLGSCCCTCTSQLRKGQYGPAILSFTKLIKSVNLYWT